MSQISIVGSQTQAWTDPLITNVNLTNTHDIGFLAKPFESALNYNNETKYVPVLGPEHLPGTKLSVATRGCENVAALTML